MGVGRQGALGLEGVSGRGERSAAPNAHTLQRRVDECPTPSLWPIEMYRYIRLLLVRMLRVEERARELPTCHSSPS